MSFLYDVRLGKVVKSKLYSNGLLLKNLLNKDKAIKELFTGGKQGVWYDPSDKSTLFQDAAGTVPVTKDGDPVALMRDKSGNGNHAIAPNSASRPAYKTDGTLHWLAFDGVDDCIYAHQFSEFIQQPYTISTGLHVYQVLGEYENIIHSKNGKARVYFIGEKDNSARLSAGGASLAAAVPFIKDEPSYYRLVFNSAQSSMQSNAEIKLSDGKDIGSNPMTDLVIARYHSDTNYCKMRMYSLVVSKNTNEQLDTYVSQKTGVTL